MSRHSDRPTPAPAPSAPGRSADAARRGPLRLDELFDLPDGPADLVTGVTLDSRLVRPGQLYVALPGRTHHGAEFAAEAARRGAVAVFTDQAGRQLAVAAGPPVIVTPDPRRELPWLAARIYGEPSRLLTTYAITGTNGKTTTSYLVDAALRAAGRSVGVVGTIGFSLNGATLPAPRTTVTTPEAPELQAVLAQMRDGGADSVVMEVSSHALALGRVDAVAFDVAAFTNLGRDHLDFHGDEETYFEAKASLFTPGRSGYAVLNVDDPRGRMLRDRCLAAGVGVSTVSLHDPSADCRTLEIRPDPGGRVAVRGVLPGRSLDFTLQLPGSFNVRNALTALAMLQHTGVDLDAAVAGLATASVPGRMQLVDLGPDAPAVYVDFAHTPQAVRAVVEAVADRRCVVVLGCGGDRDPDKRRPMGAAAASGAAVVIVTDDNPRGEDPAAIRAEVVAGASAAIRARQLDAQLIDGGDRRSAIRRALELAGPADVVVVLGKGHETGQEIAGRVLPFADVEVVREEWQERRTS